MRYDNALVLLKAETTYKTDAAPTTGANAMLATNVEIELVAAESVDRATPRDYDGHFNAQHHGQHYRISFDIELGPAAAATTPLPVSPLLLACSHDQTVNAGDVTYGLVTDLPGSATLWVYTDGAAYKARGVRGNVRYVWALGAKPMLRFEGLGLLPASGAAAESLAWPASFDVSAFNQPALVSDASITAASIAGVAKADMPWQAFEFNPGVTVEYRNLVGEEAIIVSGRQPSASLTVKPSAAQLIARIQAQAAETQVALTLTHTTGSRTLTQALGQVQTMGTRPVRINNDRGLQLDLRPLPSTGDDEMTLVSA